MYSYEIVHRIVETGVVAVVRAENADQAARICDACAEGGIRALEVTFTVPGAAAAIRDLSRRYEKTDVLVGAGTVLDTETARTAILECARFVVSPSCNSGVATLCNRYQIPYFPGAMTAGEIVAAMEAGAAIVKIFPGEAVGPGFIKAMRGPLPHAPMMPSGGVSVANAGDWIRAGCVAIGAGGTLTAGAKTGDYASVTAGARQLIAAVHAAREV